MNSRVHVHVYRRQTTKFRAHENLMILQYVFNILIKEV